MRLIIFFKRKIAPNDFIQFFEILYALVVFLVSFPVDLLAVFLIRITSTNFANNPP